MKRIIAVALLLVCVGVVSCIFDDDSNDPKVDNTYDLWGTVTDSFGEGLPDVVITLDSSIGIRTTTSDSSGVYSFEKVGSGDCTVIPAKSGYVFDPPQSELTIKNSLPAGIDFTAYPVGDVPFGSLTGHSGLNEQITSENVSAVNERVLTSFLNAVRLLENSTAKQTEISNIRIDGTQSGYIAVKHSTLNEGYQASDSFTGDMFDYSDDGELFMGGRLTYLSEANTRTGDDLPPRNWTVL